MEVEHLDHRKGELRSHGEVWHIPDEGVDSSGRAWVDLKVDRGHHRWLAALDVDRSVDLLVEGGCCLADGDVDRQCGLARRLAPEMRPG